MLGRTLFICLIGFFFSSLIPLSAIMDSDKQPGRLQVRKGVMDLREWDPEQQKRIQLDGEWEFYWNRLLSPEDFRQQARALPSAYMEVPSPWNGKTVNGVKLQAYGSATYRMVLTNLPLSGVFALKKTNIRFASKIYVNGRELLEDGRPSGDETTYFSGNRPQLGVFSADRGNVEIIVHVANYDYINSGIVISLSFGEEAVLSGDQQKSMAWEFILLTILGTLSLIYVICFAVAALYRKKDYSLLMLAAICLIFGLYHGLMGERTLFLFLHGIAFDTLYKLKDISSIIGCIVLAVFFHQLQKNIISLKTTLFVSLVLGGFLVLIPVLPIHTYTSFQYFVVVFYQLMLTWLLLKSAYRFIRSESGDRLKSFLLCLAIMLISLYSMDVILFALSVYDNLWLGQVYIIAFNLIMVFLVVLRFFEAYRTVDEMKNELLRLDKIKDDFLSNTSHELRTPLNAIVNISESLLRGVEGPVTDKQAQNLSIVIGSGKRLTQLVNELLDYSKMKHGDITLYKSSLNLKAYVDSVFRIHRFLLGGKTTTLANSVQGHWRVYADGNRLMQILHNLIGNAIKFTEQGVVKVSAEAIGDWLEIRVSDTGIGIAGHLHERIFMDFEQGELAGTNNYGGTGLGLSITKKLVELHGGHIGVKSAPGEGSTFSFTLPLAGNKFEGIEEKKPQIAEDGLRRSSADAAYSEFPLYIEGDKDEPILVVDDDPGNLQSMINLFKLEGCSIVVVDRGQLALDTLSRQRDFYLVVLDITMPDLSGYEVLRRIRERFSPFELPVLMLTASNRSEDMRLAMEYGANDFVAKPFASEELMARVRSLMQLKASVKLARDAEIAFLRSQIKPHFLHNALTVIAELCVTDAEQAEELTLQLSQYVRSSFDFKRLEAMTTLENELELVKSYVRIEKARFGARLQVEYEVDADPQLPVPPLILQPLVENAIRHGVMSNSNGGKVSISVKETADRTVVFRIEDDGRGMDAQTLRRVMDPDTAAKGVGLWNISQRLRLIYGTEIRMDSQAGAGTKIVFGLPVDAVRRNGG